MNIQLTRRLRVRGPGFFLYCILARMGFAFIVRVVSARVWLRLRACIGASGSRRTVVFHYEIALDARARVYGVGVCINNAYFALFVRCARLHGVRCP